jgi:hypothetical protein
LYRRIHCNVCICFYILVRFTLPSFSFLSSHLKQFQQISFFYSLYTNTDTSPVFTLIHPVLMPTFYISHWYLPQGSTLPSFMFFHVYTDNPRSFTLVLQACIHCALIKLTPTGLFFYNHVLLIFNSLWCTMLYYIRIEMVCLDVFHCLTFSFLFLPPVVPKHRLTNKIFVFFYTINIYNHICIYIYVYLSHMKKNVTFDFLSLAYFV